MPETATAARPALRAKFISLGTSRRWNYPEGRVPTDGVPL